MELGIESAKGGDRNGAGREGIPPQKMGLTYPPPCYNAAIGRNPSGVETRSMGTGHQPGSLGNRFKGEKERETV